MDFEPMHFQSCFQGSMIVTTNDYMMRQPKIFADDTDYMGQQVMLFQPIGVPNFNQKAREVPPFKEALTSLGLFLLISRTRLFFYIGSCFVNLYVKDD